MAAAHTHSASAPAPSPAERRSEGRAGSRRIFPPQFKLQVLDAYRRDAQCRGNQRATARKFGIHRRQIQKWLQAEPTLRAALLRRAPQPAPSPPPYSVGSPESARLPSPPPAALPTVTAVQIATPLSTMPTMPTLPPMPTLPTLPTMPTMPTPLPVKRPPTPEPIDLSVRRPSPPPPPAPVPSYLATAPQPARKPFKLFRPYLLDEQEPRGGTCERASAFVAVGSAAGCARAACPAPRWCSPVPSFSAPLR